MNMLTSVIIKLVKPFLKRWLKDQVKKTESPIDDYILEAVFVALDLFTGVKK